MQKIFCFAAFAVAMACADEVISARAYVFRAPPKGSEYDVRSLETIGVIDFHQVGGVVKVNGSVEGLTPGKHGFHVHQKGDISNACLATGPHFNPTNKAHGAPTDSERHVGDLGNLESPTNGPTDIVIEDKFISLNGAYSILGRAIVIHEKADDLGKGGTEASKVSGDAGARIACGVIGILDETDTKSAFKTSAFLFVPTTIVSLLMAFIYA